MEHSPMIRPSERSLNHTWTLQEVGVILTIHNFRLTALNHRISVNFEYIFT